MINIPRWTIWIPVAGIIFFRLRVDTEKEEKTGATFIIWWSVYWIVTSLAIWGYIFFHFDLLHYRLVYDPSKR